MTRQARILLIDDDRDFVEATVAVLASVYRVDVAYDGANGLRQARQTRPDLIILDVIMPGQDGFQVCRQIEADPSLAGVPVILLTSLPNGVNLPAAPDEGPCAAAYLEKPLRPAELLRQVSRALGGA
ncbi:MAG: response regulator [Thermoflexales bacterium]|nr:response regulator [Thermoflexales bacterium]